MWILKSAQSAFGSWTMVLGMLIGGITVFNFVQRAFSIGLSEVFDKILRAYRAVFHTLFDWLTFWIPWPVPAWVKDATVLWFVFGSALVRIVWIMYRAELEERGKENCLLDVPVVGDLMDTGYIGAAVGLLAAILAWPLLLLLMISKPHMSTYVSKNAEYGRSGGLDPRATRGEIPDELYRFDMRILYLIQLLMMVVVACAAIITNDVVQ